MNSNEKLDVQKNLEKCLWQLDQVFQWLAFIENKHIEQDGTDMGSNFAKFKIFPEYINFIQPACQAEMHFSNRNFPECAERCRNSMGEFIKYLYDINRWDKPKGMIKPDEPSLDQLIKGTDLVTFLKKQGSKNYTYSKQYGNGATHRPFSKTDINDAFKCLNDLFYLITKSLPKEEKKFASTQRFDISLLENAPKELITPLLTIENNGKEEKIPQNKLLTAVLKKNVAETFIKEKILLINKTDVLGNTPLSLAVYNDDFETVKLLLENGADPNFYFNGKDFLKSVNDEISKNEEKYSCVWIDYIEAHRCIPLIIAIKRDNPAIVELLLKYSAKTWDSCTDVFYTNEKIPTECSTVLTCAIFYKATACVRMLLRKDILDNYGKKIEVTMDPEFQDSRYTSGGRKIYGTIDGVTALMLAAENGNHDVVDQLLAKGASLDVIDKCGNSVFLHAVQNKRTDNVLGKLLREGEKLLGEELLRKMLNHAGLAGCPLSYVNVNDANLMLEYGADVNAKNRNGVSCIVDTALISPELIPWMKEHGANLNFKEFFLKNSYLEIKYEGISGYSKEYFNSVLNGCSALLMPEILDFNVPIDNIPQISPLIDSIIFSKARNIQMDIDYRDEKQEKSFLSDEQLNALTKKNPVINKLTRCVSKISSYYVIKEGYNLLVKWVNERLPVCNPQKELSFDEIKKLPKEKLDFNIDMTLEDVYQAVASERELSKKQRIALFKKYPFIKELEMRGIDYNMPEEVSTKYNADMIINQALGKWQEWKMSPSEIKTAIQEIKDIVPYEDFRISPLDDALIAKNYDAAAIYLEKGIKVKKITKILLLGIHDVSEKFLGAWNKVFDAVKSRRDIDFTDVLLTLCKNHPNADFDIAEEFINNGYNYYRFAKHVLLGSFLEAMLNCCPDYDYNNQKHFIQSTYNIEDIRIRNNRDFLEYFGETSFQEVNLRLIKNAVSFGADFNAKDEFGKSALDYAKSNGIDESIFELATKQHDVYEFLVDMSPSQKGAILGHIEINGEKRKGSIAKQLIPVGKVASDYSNQKLKVIRISDLQTKQAGEPYYKLDFAP